MMTFTSGPTSGLQMDATAGGTVIWTGEGTCKILDYFRVFRHHRPDEGTW
jgi:hypothetical protein